MQEEVFTPLLYRTRAKKVVFLFFLRDTFLEDAPGQLAHYIVPLGTQSSSGSPFPFSVSPLLEFSGRASTTWTLLPSKGGSVRRDYVSTLSPGFSPGSEFCQWRTSNGRAYPCRASHLIEDECIDLSSPRLFLTLI